MAKLPAFDVKTNRCYNPHVVILGAGASIASALSGDKNGLTVPSLDEIPKVVGFQGIIDNLVSVYGPLGNDFEEIYSNLVAQGIAKEEIKGINQQIRDYFSKLELPDILTPYDYLLLGLREKDAIFTFNWDPFLLQAYGRCSGTTKLPQLFFLHGNVSLGICDVCKVKGNAGHRCEGCGKPLADTVLLYPVKQKNYTSHPYLINEWKALRDYLACAYFVTIFGYSAPITDVEARDVLINAFRRNSSREFAEVEIIDVRPRSEIERSWEDFFFEHHYGVWETIQGSQICKHFRRSCDAFAMCTLQCHPVPENPPSEINDLAGLKSFALSLYQEEQNGTKFWQDHQNPFGTANVPNCAENWKP